MLLITNGPTHSNAQIFSNISENEPKKLYITLEYFNEKIKDLAKQIQHSGFVFDSILAITRGGFFVADPLSRIFKTKELCTINAKSYKGTEKGKLEISAVATIYGLGKRVLIVDDMVDSGDTLQQIVALLKKQYGVEEVLSAVLFRKTCTKFEPDLFAEEIEDKTWIDFYYEDFDNCSVEHLTDSSTENSESSNKKCLQFKTGRII